MQKYAKIWTHPHINLKYNNNAKYEEVSYRDRDLPAAGRSRSYYSCIFFIDIHNLSKNAKQDQEVHMNVAKSILMQPSAFFRICFWVPARSGPAERRTVVATFPLLLASSSACCRCKVEHAFAATYFAAACFPYKILPSLQSIAASRTQQFAKHFLQAVQDRQ